MNKRKNHKKKASAKKAKELNSTRNSIDKVVLFALCMIIITAPWFKGLFNDLHRLIYQLLVFALFIIYWSSKALSKQAKLTRSIYDYFALGLALCYLVALFTAAYFRPALLGALQALAYFCVFWMAGELGRNPASRMWLLRSLVVSATLICIVGLAAYFNVVDVSKFLHGERISSTFQYPNALAGYLVLTFFVTIALFETHRPNRAETIAIGTSSIVQAVVLVMTQSRGAWLAFAAAASLFVLVCFLRKRWRYAIRITLIGCITLVTVLLFSNINGVVGFVSILVFLVGAGALFHILPERISNFRRPILKLTAGIACLLVIAGVYTVWSVNKGTFTISNATLGEVAGKESSYVQARVRRLPTPGPYTINMSLDFESNVKDNKAWLLKVYGVTSGERDDLILEVEGVEEVAQYELTLPAEVDSIDIKIENLLQQDELKVNDLTLSGQGRTQKVSFALYKLLPVTVANRLLDMNPSTTNAKVRLIWSRDALKMIKDSPFTGLGTGAWGSRYFNYQSYYYETMHVHNDLLEMCLEIGYLGTIVFAIFTVLFARTVILNAKGHPWILTFAIGLLAFGLHSIVELNHAFFATCYGVWVCLGVLRPFSEGTTVKPKQSVVIVSGVFAIVIASVVGSSLLVLGEYHSGQGNDALAVSDLPSALHSYEKSVHFDKWNSESWGRIVQIHMLSRKDKADISAAIDAAERALALEQQHPAYQVLLGKAYLAAGKQQGLELLRQAVNNQPFNIQLYDEYSKSLAQRGLSAWVKDAYSASDKHFNELEDVVEFFYTSRDNISEKCQWFRDRFVMTARMHYSLGVKAFCRGEAEVALSYFKQASEDENLELVTSLWQRVISGDVKGTEELMEKHSELRGLQIVVDKAFATNY